MWIEGAGFPGVEWPEIPSEDFAGSREDVAVLTWIGDVVAEGERGVTTSFTYDANGNLDAKTGAWDYDWNPENLMTVAKLNRVQQQAYAYDGLGRRMKVEGTLAATWTVSIVSGMTQFTRRTKAAR